MPDHWPWRTYQRRTTGPVQAFRNDGPRSVLVRGDVGEAVMVRSGEWAVRSAGREARALSPETFEALYVAAEEE